MANEAIHNLQGKRVLVTGASSGIGFQLALDLITSGAQVGAHYRSMPSLGNARSSRQILTILRR